MTQKVFWSAPYQTELATTVAMVSGGDIILIDWASRYQLMRLRVAKEHFATASID